MTKHPVVALRSVELGVTDLVRASRFYSEVWGLEPVSRTHDQCLLRANGPEHHAVHLRAMPVAQLLGVDFAASDAAAVDLLHERALANASRVVAPPHALADGIGSGYGLSLLSPDGLRFGVSADVARHPQVHDDKTRPARLTHVVVNSADAARQVAWCESLLGLRVSDSTRTQVFLRCDADHHSLAFAHGSGPSLNHAAFEMADIDGLMYGAGRLLDHGHEMEWGLGRHGPGSNVFSYFVDTDGFAVEYTTEVDQIDESTYVARTPDYWTAFPRRPCRWGVARKPSERLIAAFAGRGLAGAAG